MTTTVTVEAHCSKEKEVRIAVDNGNTGETIVIQDGEKWSGVVYDLKKVTVQEVNKPE
jgi:hypothetical protein